MGPVLVQFLAKNPWANPRMNLKMRRTLPLVTTHPLQKTFERSKCLISFNLLPRANASSKSLLSFRMAKELNRNWKPELSEPFFQEPEPETEAGTVFQEPKPEPCLSVKTLLKNEKTLSPKEPLEPNTGTARTVPCMNSNRTEPWLPCSLCFWALKFGL